MVKGSLKVQEFFSMYHPLIAKWIILRKGVLGVLVLAIFRMVFQFLCHM